MHCAAMEVDGIRQKRHPKKTCWHDVEEDIKHFICPKRVLKCGEGKWDSSVTQFHCKLVIKWCICV